MNLHILFVDDELNVLQGLQRMLRVMRHEWNMAFAQSGQEALDILSKESFDVVVSDMRMPGMDGAQLLNEVMKRYPQIVRIVLSGQSDREMVLKSVRPAHQYLSKPCDPQTLKSTIAHVGALREVLVDSSLRHTVSQMNSLPTLPSTYKEIIEELQAEEPSIKKVGEIISNDVGMTAKILQLVNSAFFGPFRHVSSPSQAAGLLGLETIKPLVLLVQIFSQFDQENLPRFSLSELRDRCLATGALARAIAKLEDQGQTIINDAFMAGLLHDLGKVVLAVNFPERYNESLAAAQEKNIPPWEAERITIGTSHSEAGAYLMGLWGLHDHIVETLAFHHCPEKLHEKGFNPPIAVHVADALVHGYTTGSWHEFLSRINLDLLAELGMAHRLPIWKQICRYTL
jgi:HD-like signal output (HDOD) protein/CheY-like chemotaxis protein